MRMPSTMEAGATGEISGDGVGKAVGSSGGQIASDGVGAVTAGGRGEATGFGGAPCETMASISASNSASRVFASLSESLAMFFKTAMSHFQGNKVQDACLCKGYSERRKDKRFTEALLHRNSLLDRDDGVTAGLPVGLKFQHVALLHFQQHVIERTETVGALVEAGVTAFDGLL